MPDANISEIARFFKTGNPERDGLKAFSEEWKKLSDDEKAEFKTLVGAELHPA